MSNVIIKKSNIHQTISYKEDDLSFLENTVQPYILQGIKLGQATNLLYGLKTGLSTKTSNVSPFFTPAIEPLPLIDAVISPNDKAYWQLPRITIHSNVNSLLSAVFPYTINPLTGDLSTFSLPSGPLLIEDLNKSAVITELSSYLGVDLTVQNLFMLVELNRSVGSASHNYTAGTGGNANEHLTPKAEQAVNSLNEMFSDSTGKLNATNAKEFINSYNTVGTHYVSKITAGDRIFQVFAYNSKTFVELTNAFNASSEGKGYVDGIEANSFQYYTTPFNSSTGVELGYVTQLGNINIVSSDSVFQNSLKAGLWNDANRAHGNSIFSAFNNPEKIQLTDFKSVVRVSFELTPIGNLIPVDKSEKGRNYWNRLFKGAMLQKYGHNIRVTYPTQNSYQWKNLLSNSGAWVSTIATPSVNVYDGHLALDKIQLTNREIVKDFSSWSVVMESQKSSTPIPGEAISLFSYLIDTTGPDAPPSIELSSKTAFNNIKMACGEMDGALTIGYTNATEQKTVIDGIVLISNTSKDQSDRSTITINSDLFGEQDSVLLTNQSQNLNFSIVTCQTLLYSRGNTAKDAQDLAHNCLVWLTDIIPNTETISSELATVRLRASYLAHVAGNLEEEGVTVPYLTYKSYEKYIDEMSKAAGSLNATIYNYQNKIELQKNAELAATNAQEINDNIKKSGNLLKEYIDAVAINQGDIAANYDNIINTKKRELKSTISSFSSLVKGVEDQKKAVRYAKQDFEKAMVDYETTLIIKAVIDISMAFMAVGSTIVIPSSSISALASLGSTAQKIQKILNVTTKIYDLEKTIEKSVKDIVSVTNTLDQLAKAQLDMPSSLEWSEMGINFEASLASTPSEVAGAKAKYVAAFKILVLRAQAMISAQSKIAQINAEIMLNEAQSKINQDQKDRLNKIVKGLNYGSTTKPNLSEVDLLSLTGYVQSQLNQVLGSLAQALILQDSAVQFELLANPTPIKKFDLNSLHLVMVSQQANIITAKQAFNPPPFVVNDPIQYIIKSVPVKEFTKGNTYEFTIQPSAKEFQPYNMIRINQVVVDVPQIKGSKNGKYRLDLSCLGNPFQDRNPSGEPLVFNTMARYFGPFEYQADNHKPIFGNETGAIAKDITHITPLSTWQVTMPELPVNENIDFGENEFVDIVLSFRIEALAQNALSRFCALKGKSANKMSHSDLVKTMLLMAKKVQPLKNKSATPQLNEATPQDATLQNMLEQMNQAQGVLKGWDCVLNMLEEPVNKFLAKQYEEKYPTQKPMVVEVGFCVPSPSPIPSFPGTIFNYTKFSVNLAQPLLEFQGNNSNYVKVTQLIQSGFIQTGSMFSPKENQACPIPLNIENPEIKWGEKKIIDVSKKPKLVGTVGLGLVQGLVEPILPDGKKGDKNDSHSVILDFSKGSFIAENLNIDTDNATLNLQLSNWFETSEIKYLINTVVFNDATTLKSLQPTKFKLNVLTTNSLKNILQVFITTTGQQQSNLTINVNEPIPDGYHNSLMINTKIMFNNIFVDSFNRGTSNIQVAPVIPKNDFTTWSAKITSGTVSGEAKFNNTGSSETRINASGNTIVWPLKDLTFTPTIENGIQLTYEANQNVGFQNRRYTCYASEFGSNCSWGSWNSYSVDVNVKLTGNYPLQVINSGKQQEIQIASTPPTVTVTPPDLKPTGPCECNDNDLKIQVGNILSEQVPQKLKDSMGGIKFSPISVFALYNLLFPTDNFIEMKSAYVPGDLVVLGTFNKFVDDKK
ncbi:hypothetical protein [Flavobacterium cerinum]|uniref:MACPF domain-containing protein n=1 Tax=Flavobacterium cerinum TaxID=2502784 RepID=A0A444GL28_9FLAO|nr:hypothetical protein [Flavobacterium cerinum]RWW91708.1 hypothetical protein EPI11_18230 [Flavobacterium cerinum]